MLSTVFGQDRVVSSRQKILEYETQSSAPKLGLHISRKYRKFMFENMFLSCRDMNWSLYRSNDHKY